MQTVAIVSTFGRLHNSLAAAPKFSSQLQRFFKGEIHIAVECCSILAEASSHEF